MIHQKEFYFLRHGQTDGNLDIRVKMAQEDVSLNATGVLQAQSVEPIIAGLPIKTVCCSPLRRAKETKDITCARVSAPHRELINLTECRVDIWREMTALGAEAALCRQEPVFSFMQRVAMGVNEALSHEGPVLIVGHGGIHWAMCCFMQLEGDWISPNCVPIHFFCVEGKWKGLNLSK